MGVCSPSQRASPAAAGSKWHRAHVLPLSAGVLGILHDAAAKRSAQADTSSTPARRRWDHPICDPDDGALPGWGMCVPAMAAPLDPEQQEPFAMHDLRRMAATQRWVFRGDD
jgi:hypothetical protein